MTRASAIKTILAILIAVIIFHLCILLKIIPYELTWGGRLKSDSEMYVFETISILINLFLGLILLIKGNYIKQLIPERAVNAFLWIFLALFALNTVGNLFAETTFEKSMSLLTLGLAILIWIVIRSKDDESVNKA